MVSLFFCLWRLDSNGAAGVGGRAEQSPAPTSGLLLPFTIHPAGVGILGALRAAGAAAPTERIDTHLRTADLLSNRRRGWRDT